MELKVMKKLYLIMSDLVGQKLIDSHIVNKNIDDKDILAVELKFKDSIGLTTTAVFILDKELTEGNYEKLAKKLIE